MVGYAENCLLFYSDYIIIQLGMKKKTYLYGIKYL